MSDNAKLKELAEALKRAIEQAEHKPGEWAGTAQSMGGICCPGVPFQIGKPWAKEEPWASFSYKRDSWLAVAAVNALPRLLGLIAEIERLQGCEDVLRQLASHVGAGGYNAPEVDPETFARKIMDGINILNDPMAQLVIKKGEQIDQLRAEVAGLRTGYEAYERVNAELKAENEALRREREGKVLCDLELFETLRDSANTEADEHRQCMATYRPLRQANLDSVVKKCDDLLAAMGQGEQS